MTDSGAHPDVPLTQGSGISPGDDALLHTLRAGSMRASVPILHGVDVSAFQGAIRWRQAVSDGIQFAFAKASEGIDWPDPDFAANWLGMKQAGIPRIAYHFFYDHLPALEQCDFHHGLVRGKGHYLYGDMGALDVEEASVSNASLCVPGMIAYIRHFWQTVNKPLTIYTNYDTWVNLLGNPDHPVFRACPLWLADIGASVPTLAPWPKGLTFWQFGWAGHIRGIDTAVDVDRFYGNRAQLARVMRVVPKGV